MDFIISQKELFPGMSISDPPHDKNLLARAIGVLTDSASTFEDIIKKPDFVLPVIFIVLSGILGLVPLSHSFGTMPELMPPSTSELSKSAAMGTASTAFIVSQFIWWPLRALIFVGAGALIGSRIDFKKSLAVSGYLNITLVLSGIITAITVAVTGQAVVLGFGITLTPDQLTTPWGIILSSINIFSIIYIILSSIALSRLWNVKISKSAAITIIMWALVIALSAWSAHLTSKLTQLQMGIGPG
ncbi:MAG: YIP1 family protein [Firmicutes bacterium]|nr:YIP1 family protein [Bacillota bacterium]